jgi:hypothetical protein
MILMRGWKFHTGIQRKKAEDDKKKKKNTRKSFKPQAVKCMKPNLFFSHSTLWANLSTIWAHMYQHFRLTSDIFFSSKDIHASIMYRVTSKVVAIANSTAKEF